MSSLTLSLGDTHVHAVLRPSARRALGFLGRAPAKSVVECMVEVRPGRLADTLEQALAEMARNSGVPLRRVHLDVQLGFEYSRVSLINVAQPGVLQRSEETQRAFVSAWAREFLHLDPATQVLRWQHSADAKRLLVTSVDRVTLDLLQALSTAHGVRFGSCKPAVLQSVGSKRGSALARTLVWTECPALGTRSPRVQLLRILGNEIVAQWRGWASEDAALDGAIRRFEACNIIPRLERKALVRWLAPAWASALAH